MMFRRVFMPMSLLLATLHGTAQEVVRSMLRLPDTGQTTSYTATFGEDADFTVHAPFFTVNGDGTVTDTITGLMWQQSDGGEMTIEAATAYCETLVLGGYSDWRLPTAHEAFSILNHQLANPALDPAIFPISDAEYWWTSIRQDGDSNKVWVTNAGGGIGNHPKTETISAGGVKRFHVRAVRDVVTPPTVTSHYVLDSDGTATDQLTGLLWQPVSPMDTLSWEDALNYADTLTADGWTDWRLPNIKELRSINDETVVGPSFDPFVFGTGGDRKYWSSTSLPNQPAKAWYLNAQFGITTYDFKTVRHRVRCVRGGAADINTESTASSLGRPWRVWPNPADEMTLVNTGDLVMNARNVVVLDHQGRMHPTPLSKVDAHTARIDTRSMPNGIYLLRSCDGSQVGLDGVKFLVAH